MPSNDTANNGAALPRLLVNRPLSEAVEARLAGDYQATSRLVPPRAHQTPPSFSSLWIRA